MRSEPLHIGFFHLGADLERASKSLPKGRSGLWQTIGACPTFLMVGTIEPRKGHVQALRAFELLWADGFDVNLAIVGRQGWRMDELVKRIRKHSETGKRLFWLDDASDEDLVQVYESSAALLAASEGEGFGLPLVEAARYGLPIIARDLPVFRELASEHAFFFAGREPRELADAVKEWLKLSVEGQAPASGPIPRLSWAESAQQLLDVALADAWYGSWNSDARVCADGLSPHE